MSEWMEVFEISSSHCELWRPARLFLSIQRSDLDYLDFGIVAFARLVSPFPSTIVADARSHCDIKSRTDYIQVALETDLQQLQRNSKTTSDSDVVEKPVGFLGLGLRSFSLVRVHMSWGTEGISPGRDMTSKPVSELRLRLTVVLLYSLSSPTVSHTYKPYHLLSNNHISPVRASQSEMDSKQLVKVAGSQQRGSGELVN